MKIVESTARTLAAKDIKAILCDGSPKAGTGRDPTVGLWLAPGPRICEHGMSSRKYSPHLTWIICTGIEQVNIRVNILAV